MADWAALRSERYDAKSCLESLLAGDLAHGIVERQAENLDEEVNGISSEVALGPAPITVFEQEALVRGQFEVLGGPFDELEAPPLEQRHVTIGIRLCTQLTGPFLNVQRPGGPNAT